MYLVASASVIITSIALTHFRLNEPFADALKECASWFLFAFLGFGDNFAPQQITNINEFLINLLYTWKFFLIFRVLLFFADKKLARMISAAAAMLCYFTVFAAWTMLISMAYQIAN